MKQPFALLLSLCLLLGLPACGTHGIGLQRRQRERQLEK